jgi:hypothetical protein
MARAARTSHDAGNTMTLLHEIEWVAPLIEPYRDPDAEALRVHAEAVLGEAGKVRPEQAAARSEDQPVVRQGAALVARTDDVDRAGLGVDRLDAAQHVHHVRRPEQFEERAVNRDNPLIGPTIAADGARSSESFLPSRLSPLGALCRSRRRPRRLVLAPPVQSPGAGAGPRPTARTPAASG